MASALLMIGALAASQAREPRPPDTDQTVTVTRGARLSIDNFAGEVTLKTWDRDQLRVQARHPARTKVDIKAGATAVTVRAHSSGAPGSVDYQITAPAWMAAKIEGTYNFINVEGTQAEVTADTTRGDIVVRGAGAVTAKSIEGEVIVENARGRVSASSVQQGIRLTGVTGDITAETNNGSIIVTNVTSANVEVTTINGHIVYEGTVAERGRYRFATHNGHITATIPESSNVTFNVRTYNGRFSSQLPAKGTPGVESRQGRRMTYTLGNGSADMEMESFGGHIRVRRPGADTSAKDKEKDKHQDELLSR